MQLANALQLANCERKLCAAERTLRIYFPPTLGPARWDEQGRIRVTENSAIRSLRNFAGNVSKKLAKQIVKIQGTKIVSITWVAKDEN